MAEFPALPLWTDAYLSDTLGLSLEEHGAFLKLMMIAWRTKGCALDDDDQVLARMLGITPARFRKAIRAQVVDRFFEKNGGKLTQKRLLMERRRVEKISGQRRTAARAKWLKENELEDANASAPQGNPQPPRTSPADASISISKKKKESPPYGGPKKEDFDEDIPAHLDQRPLAQQTHRSKGNGHDPPKRGCRLPEDWEPDAELIAFAESLGLDADATADRFRDHWLAATGQTATKRDWKAAWRNWCRRAAERGETKRSTGTGTPAHQPSAAMRAWLRERGVEEGARLVSRRAGGRQAQFSAANGERIDVQADAATPREPWPERA